MSGQTRLESIAEAITNTVVGFGINYVANLILLPMFGFASLTPGKNFLLGLVYSAISVIRGYILRRYFDAHLGATSEFIHDILRRILQSTRRTDQ